MVENNVFVECEPAVHIDARGLRWASTTVNTTMREDLEAMPYTSALWRERYPELVGILGDEPGAPKGNVVTRNVSWGGQWDDVGSDAAPYVSISDNWTEGDPLFAGTPPETFRLRDDSPVFQTGFEQIAFEDIGIYEDAYRRELPIQ